MIENSHVGTSANRDENFQKRQSEKLIPMLIRDLNRMMETKHTNDLLQFEGQDVDRIQIVGRIVKIENDQTRIRLFIDDGSGIYMLSGNKKDSSMIPKNFMQIRIQLAH